MFPKAAVVVLSTLELLQCALASPNGPAPDRTINKRAVTLTLSSASQVATASDPYWNRDSCNSVRVDTRELWTCRDSIGKGKQFYSSTASWSNFNSGNGPVIKNGRLPQYGDNTYTYFKVPSNECGGSSGTCTDGTRWTIWPDSPPLPVKGANNAVTMYTWIRNIHVNQNTGAQIVENPSTGLYRAQYNPANQGTSATLPTVTLVNEHFWAADTIPYGQYGWVISPNGNTAYLYGQLNNGTNNIGAALARVPIGSIEDKTKYSYYNNGGWSSKKPGIGDKSALIPNAGTRGQGTFYYSSYYTSYIWIGTYSASGNGGVGPGFYVATAPAPEGPWTTPSLFYSGQNGNNSMGLQSYSEQAHPGLTAKNGNGKDIYLTFTQVNEAPDGTKEYVTPVIHAIWE